jgi:hypothetical protein
MEKRLSDVWDKLPYLEHTKKYYDEKAKTRIYEVCGKKFQENCKISYILPVLEKFELEYGERARMAEQNQGIDYKAVSHAFRACFEVREICETWDLKFPLKDRGFLLDIKHGNITDWQKKLEVEIEKTKEALAKSEFPEKVDEERADQMLYTMLSNYYHDWY